VASKEEPPVEKVVFKGNPILNGIFIDESHYIGCGFDNAPMLFTNDGK
jgi:hypothetical protein